MYIEGYASVFGVVDSYNDIVERGSFVKTLAKDAKRVRFLFPSTTSIRWWVKGLERDRRRIGNRSFLQGEDLQHNIRQRPCYPFVEDEALDEISFAYQNKGFVFDKETGIRHLKEEVDLIEISLVTRAANERAIVTGAERKFRRGNITGGY